jgi:hypothetical protein
MKLKGNYNYGIYQPPSGLDAVRYSQQNNADLALQTNNLQTGQKTGFRQNVSTSAPRFLDPNTDLITKSNNFDIDIFNEMIRGGWGKPTPPLIPAPPPYTTPPFSPEVQRLIEEFPPEPPNPTYPPYPFPDPDNPTTPPPYPPAPTLLPSPPISQNNDTLCKAVVTRYNGDRRLTWAGPRIAEDGWQSKGIAQVNYTEDGTLQGSVTSWMDSYYWERSSYLPSKNLKSSSRPPLRPVGSPFWTVIGRVRRRQLSTEIFEYWGLESDIYANLRSSSRGWGPVWNGSFSVWWFWSQGYRYSIFSVDAAWCPKKTIAPKSPVAPTPLRKKMSNCCDCNTIATIVEEKLLAQTLAQQKLFENLKDHIDMRATEIIAKHLQHLQALDFEDALKFILERLNQTESNLWNGPAQ